MGFIVSFIFLFSPCGLKAAEDANTSTEVQEPAVASSPSPETALPATAKPLAFSESFSLGVKRYQEKNYSEAQKLFSAALQENPENTGVLVNLGLTEFNLGKKGVALGFLRKAHTLNPDFSTPVSAIRFIEKSLENKEIPHEIRSLDNIKDLFITPISLNSYLVFLGLCFFATGWLWIDFLAELKNLKKTRSRLSEIPSLKIIVLIIFLMASAGTLIKFYYAQKPVATITANKVSILSAPNEDAVQLFDIYEGLQVEVESTHQDWVQVSYPGTPVGWIQKKDLFITSGSLP